MGSPMRNDTPFSRAPFNRLVLVNSTGRRQKVGEMDDAAADYPAADHASALTDGVPARALLLTAVTASIVCATIALATGSYAFWLSRQQDARQALTDVNDLLLSCQKRMEQLEAEVQRIPG